MEEKLHFLNSVRETLPRLDPAFILAYISSVEWLESTPLTEPKIP